MIAYSHQVTLDSDDDQKEDIDKKRKGRKNIKKILNEKELKEETRAAAEREKERIKRIAERQKLYNEIFPPETETPGVSRLVLEFNPETKESLVEVNPILARQMKDHQVKGIRFMWDNTIESVEKIEEEGSGCILAHSMGLGKTFQVIAFVHTLLTHKLLKKHMKTVLIIVPVNTIKNWVQEFVNWLQDDHLLDFPIHDLSEDKTPAHRADTLDHWRKAGGVCIVGLTLFSQIVNAKGRKTSKSIIRTIQEALVEPGPDLVVVDEGHLLKNSQTAANKAVNSIATLRRVVLTGTPLQNNLDEYHVMVHFVKPNLLGTKKEFSNRFANPISNGQHIDSTDHDVHRMKKRVHVLHKLLAGCVQRFDYGVLRPYLQPKHEYVISIRLSEKQIELYQQYLDNVMVKGANSILVDFCNLRLIWNHPGLLYAAQTKRSQAEERKREKEWVTSGEDSSPDLSDEEVVHDGNSNGGSVGKRVTRSNPIKEELLDKPRQDPEELFKKEWFTDILPFLEMDKIEFSTKIVILFAILDECEKIGDKVIVFSQSLDVLDYIERCLGSRHNQKFTENNGYAWIPNVDYCRIDGSTSGGARKTHIDKFNDPENLRARLFLLSTKAGGLGINLVGANRCIIFDASWNPTHDVQAIYRIYRFGQTKPVYIYRFIAQGTMEEKIYERQIIKQSLSVRVVDELQVGRHFRAQEVAELYVFDPDTSQDRSLPNMPKDKLLADIIMSYKNLVVKYHEHDSLLENKPEEDLTEEERMQAWKEFEDVSCLLIIDELLKCVFQLF